MASIYGIAIAQFSAKGKCPWELAHWQVNLNNVIEAENGKLVEFHTTNQNSEGSHPSASAKAGQRQPGERVKPRCDSTSLDALEMIPAVLPTNFL